MPCHTTASTITVSQTNALQFINPADSSFTFTKVNAIIAPSPSNNKIANFTYGTTMVSDTNSGHYLAPKNLWADFSDLTMRTIIKY